MQLRTPNPHCLIVEDEVLVGMDLEDALSAAGFAVDWVASPEGVALARVFLADADIVVLDVKLRDRTCTALARDLRSRGIPVVVHSGYAANEVSGDIGDLPWLQKPADIPTLVAAVAAALPRPGAHPGAVAT